MSNVVQEDSDFDWKAAFNRLQAGQAVEIPCESERDCVRRENQVAKRTQKRGIAVEVRRGEGVLRIEPRAGVGANAAAAGETGPE